MHGWLTPILLSFASAASSPQPTALFPLVVGEANLDVALIRAEAEAAAADRRGLRLLGAEQRAVDPQRAAACGANSRCLADVYADSPSTLVLVVAVNAVASPMVLSARLLDVAQARFVAEQYLDVDEASELPAQLRTLIGATFDLAGHRRWANLLLDVKPANARVEVGSIVAVGGPIWTPPGSVELTIRADGHRTQHLSLELEAGERRSLAVALEPEPTVLASPWFWVGAAAIVAAVAVVTVVAWPERNTILCLPPCD